MNDVHRLVWLLGMSACFRVTLSQQTFTGVQYQYSEQYKDMGKTSKTRNKNDAYRLLDALKQWIPFEPNTALYGLVNGVTANEGFYPSEPMATSTKCSVWDVKKTNDGLGSNECLVILFIHAILVVTLRQGCKEL